MCSLNLLLGIAALCMALPRMVHAIPLRQFYPYGPMAGDTTLPRNDDDVSSPISIAGSGFGYFGTTPTSVFVNNNGPISFGASMTGFTPRPLPVPGSPPFIVPFWVDVDTRTENGGFVHYRMSTDSALLLRASNEISSLFSQRRRRFTATWLFIATWESVGYWNQNTERPNTFQCVLITDGECSFVTFLYADGLIQWTAHGSAQAGFDAGDRMRFFSLPDSGTNDIMNIDTTTNAGVPGQWIFRVDLNDITEPSETVDFMYMCGSDPHFATMLPGGALLCYTFQGRHNTTFNLLANDQLQMNALFVPDETDWDNTWLGSIGVTALHDGKKTTSLQFTAADQLVGIGERLELDAKTLQRLSFNKGNLSILKVPSNHSQRYPRVEVEFMDSKLSFTVGFTKNNHLDLYWHSTGIPSKTSTGVVGQFFRDGVKIDAAAQLLYVPGHPPVPVEKRDLWKFMSKSLLGDRRCWTSAYSSSQGAGIVAGTYEDYIVDGLLAVGQ